MEARPLSAVVITLNEESNIGRCLDSLRQVADEIIVADSGSTDNTRKIAEAKGARFLEKEWLGFAGQKNWANEQAAHDLILSLDADEELSPELTESIRQARHDKHTDAWSFRRRTNYCGKWIHYTSWHPDVKIRLFDRRKARWVGDYVHETLELEENANIGRLSGFCFHYTTTTLEQHAASRTGLPRSRRKNCRPKASAPTGIICWSSLPSNFSFLIS